mgnify:CR=1 FL=1
MGLSGEEKIGVLPLEIERLDIMGLAQFSQKVGVELGYSSSEGVETGQYRYLQSLFAFLFCYVCCVEALDELVGNVEAGISGNNGCGEDVS